VERRVPMTLEPIANERKNVTQYIFRNARPILIAFILFVVIVVMTTDIRLVTISSLTDLGLEFFILLFCSYGMYICCTDGGVKSGCGTETYKNAVKRFDELKQQIEASLLPKMNDFCVHYINEELKQARMQYLGIACIPYDTYIEKYAKLGKTDIDALTDLTSLQKRAVKKANSLRPIKLTPEMILTQGKTTHSRSVLAANPGTMKNVAFTVKIFKMSFISICMPLIALDVIMEPSWIVFAEVCLKLFTVVLNGFDGHKDGYNNITVHTVNYMNNQCSLMQQAIQFF
jgi:hypothetical protein